MWFLFPFHHHSQLFSIFRLIYFQFSMAQHEWERFFLRMLMCNLCVELTMLFSNVRALKRDVQCAPWRTVFYICAANIQFYFIIFKTNKYLHFLFLPQFTMLPTKESDSEVEVEVEVLLALSLKKTKIFSIRIVSFTFIAIFFLFILLQQSHLLEMKEKKRPLIVVPTVLC